MNKSPASGSLSSIDPRTKWVLLGLVAWIIIPWKGLEYGLFQSSGSEIFDAFAWKSVNTSLIPLAVFLLFLLRPWKSYAKANLIDAAVSLLAPFDQLLLVGFTRKFYSHFVWGSSAQ